MIATEQSNTHETESVIHAVVQEKQVHLHTNNVKLVEVKEVYIVEWAQCKWSKLAQRAKDRAVNFMVVVSNAVATEYSQKQLKQE